jgi:hypothetical protein
MCHKLSPGRRGVLDKPKIAQLVKIFPPFIEHEIYYKSSHELANGPNRKSDKCNPYPRVFFL